MPRTSAGNARIRIDDAGIDPPTLLFAMLSDWNYDVEEADDTYRVIGNLNELSDAGPISVTGSGTLWVDPTDPGQAKIGVGLEASVQIRELGDGSGLPELTGDVRFKSLRRRIPADGYSGWEFTFRADQPLTPGTQGP